jgi:hypothetical protein
MSHAGFQWSDEQPQGPPASGGVPSGDSRFVWSDEESKKTSSQPNAGLAPPAGGPHSFPVEEDQPSAGKLQGLPGVHPHTPTFQEGKSDLMLASAPLAATMSVPRIIGSVVGGVVGDKGGRFLARTAGGGDTAQEIAGDVGGLVGGGIGAHRLGNGIKGMVAPIAEAIHGPEPTLAGAPPPATPLTGEYVDTPAAPARSGPPIAHAQVVEPKLLPQSASVARDLPYRKGPGEVAPEDVNAPAPNILAGRQGIRIAPPIPQRPGLALPEAQDPILERLRANAARIAQEGHGDEIPEPQEASPTTTNLNQDLTPALKASLRKALAAKKVRVSKAQPTGPQPIQ